MKQKESQNDSLVRNMKKQKKDPKQKKQKAKKKVKKKPDVKREDDNDTKTNETKTEDVETVEAPESGSEIISDENMDAKPESGKSETSKRRLSIDERAQKGIIYQRV